MKQQNTSLTNQMNGARGCPGEGRAFTHTYMQL